ncbi:MAG: DUF1576 domain-containing protein [Oscillospiraceae bacterium]|jgi:hypothetical protein|nr:DUF1576 domain-containing protein [Oscillospiraceae bacterium]
MVKVQDRRFKLYNPYVIMLAVNVGFLIFAFSIESPANLIEGFVRIIISRSILVTDYIAVGGLGATLLNSSIVGIAGIVMLILLKVKPNGATIMAMWLTTGFAFFGKNVYNMIPLTCGVWLFSKYSGEPFINYYLTAMLAATLSPTVSELSFMGIFSWPFEILMGILFGFVIGFIFPSVSEGTVRVHGGYNLYNMGFAGGLICTVLLSVLNAVGISVDTVQIISSGNNTILAACLYTIAAAFLCCGLFLGNTKENIKEYLNIFKRSGRLISDFYFDHGNSVFINMAVLCAFYTTVVLALGAELNGPTVAGILTIMGFGCFGKHLKNVIPISLGAVVSAFFNRLDPASPANVIAILFSTGLAPIAGQYGWIWGAVAGFLHVNITLYIGELSGGMNLYSNGFAAGFVAMLLLPVITAFKKDADL